MEKLRPIGIYQIITHPRHNGVSLPGDALDNPLRFLPAATGIDDHQLSHAMRAVVSRQHAQQLVVRAGYRTRKEQRVRVPGIAAINRPLPSAIGVHGHELPQKYMANAGVVPAVIEHLTGGQYDRMKVVILIKANLADVSTVVVHEIQIAHASTTVPTRYRLIRRRRAEKDFSIWQIAGIHRVHICRQMRDLPFVRTVDPHFPDLPISFGRLRHKQTLSSKMQINFTDIPATFRSIDRAQDLRRRKPVQGGRFRCRNRRVPGMHYIRDLMA